MYFCFCNFKDRVCAFHWPASKSDMFTPTMAQCSFQTTTLNGNTNWKKIPVMRTFDLRTCVDTNECWQMSINVIKCHIVLKSAYVQVRTTSHITVLSVWHNPAEQHRSIQAPHLSLSVLLSYSLCVCLFRVLSPLHLLCSGTCLCEHFRAYRSLYNLHVAMQVNIIQRGW